jgi:hypothetical protein
MFEQIWTWLKLSDNQRTLTFIGAGIVDLSGLLAVWLPTLIKTESKPTVFHVCSAESETDCKPHVYFIGCQQLNSWANSTCSKWHVESIN